MALPQVGLQVILDIKQFQSQYNKLQKIIDDLIRSFLQAMGIKGIIPAEQAMQIQVAQEKIRSLEATLRGYAQTVVSIQQQAKEWGVAPDPRVMDALGQQYKQTYGEMIAAQKELTAAQGVSASSLSAYAIAFTAVSVAAGAVTKAVKEGVDAFKEQTTTLRELQIITGMTSLQTAALAKQARDLGLEAGVVQRGVFAFYRQIESASEALETGIEFNNNFTRALDKLKVSLYDAQGYIRPYNDLLLETFEKIRNLPSQVEKTALASQLFGRQNAQLVVLLADSIRSMEDQEEILRKYGLVAGPQATVATRNLQQAESDLADSWTKLKSVYGEFFAPVLELLNRGLSLALVQVKEFVASMGALYRAIAEFGVALATTGSLQEAARKGLVTLRDSYEELSHGISAAENAQEKQALEEAHLANIAEQAANRRERAIEREQDALKELAEAREKAFRDYQRGLENLARSEQRAEIERNLRAGWEVQDTLRRNAQRQEDLQLDLQRRLAQINRKAQQDTQDERRQQQRKLEDLERQHQMRLLQIQYAYQDAVEEALRSNDTVAILRAMRERKRSIRDEELRQSERREDLQRDYEQRREDQTRELQRQREEAQIAYQQSLEDLRTSIQREDEEKKLQAARDATLRRLQHQWALEDLRRQYDEQLEEAQRAYDKQRKEYAQFLTDMGTTAAQGIITISNQIAAAVTTGSQTVLAAEEQWLKRHFYLMTEAVQSSIGLSREQQWLQRHQYFRGQGGLDIVNSPTTFVAGEAGPELAAFIPLRHSMSINHSFGNLPLSLNGSNLAGVSRQQTEQLVYSLLYQLPDLLKGRRQ